MSLSWSDFMKILELKARYFFGAWVFGALLIFLPADIKQQMAIATPEVVRPWLGFSTLAAFVFWLVLAVLRTTTFFFRWSNERKARTEILSYFETLSQGERDIFIQCLSLNKRTINRNINDGSTNSMKQKRLLVMASQGSVLSMPHTIPKFIWDHIKKNEVELFPELYDENAMQEFQQRQQHGWIR